MASHPPSKCCTVGVKHEGKAVGEIKKIGETRTYCSYPEDKSTKNAVLIITDIMGMDVLNPQLIADQFAANGYFTVMPDLFYGDAAEMNKPGFDVYAWLKNHTAETVDPVIKATLKEMRESLGCKNIGGVGYCFGGKYLCRWLKPDEGGFDAGYTAHPSFVDVDELKGIKGPLSISAAEIDQIFPAPKRRETEDILEKHTVPYQINLFSDVEHGFAVRGDLSKPRQKFAKEQAFLQAVHWFDEYIKKA